MDLIDEHCSTVLKGYHAIVSILNLITILVNLYTICTPMVLSQVCTVV